MNFDSDRRGRIPFAFLGAILLLSSSLYAISLAPPPATAPAADEVVTDAQVETRLALEAAIREADRKAAAEPVLEPSESGLGAVLPNSKTFERALELRIAGAARRAVNGTNASRESLKASVSLPPIHERESANRALQNVTITQVNGELYRVRIEGLHVTVTRHERPIDRFRYNATITTELPSLELHERTNRFESRLNAGLADPGLTRDLTARLFPIVWMRGYAQYGGAPITNVLANRHVEVMTNDAVLAQQAAVFGTEDPAGRRATRIASADVAARDAFLGAEETVKSHLSAPQSEPKGAGEPDAAPEVPLPSVVDTEQSVDANHTADSAYLDFVEGQSGRGLDATVDAVYRADVRVEGRATARKTERDSSGSPPENSSRIFTSSRTDRWLDDGSFADGAGSTLRTYTGRVIEKTVRTHYWAGNGTWGTTKTFEWTTYRVGLDLTCRYRDPGIAPDRPDKRCPFGPVARDRIVSAGTNRLLSGSALENRAIDAVTGSGDTSWRRVDISPPESAVRRAQRRTADLRRDVRDISVSLETRSVASSTNPAAELAGAIGDDRAELLGTPSRYGSAADRAVAAARVTYLDRVQRRLESKTPVVQKAQNAFADQLASHMVPSSPPERSTPSTDTYVATVDGGPAYLSVDPPGESEPRLSARNVNLFTIPYGDAADAVSERIGEGSQATVSLRTAAQTLAAVDASGAGDRRARSTLRRDVADAVDSATDQYVEALAGSMGTREAHRLVESTVERWDSVAARGLAVTDGRMARAIAAELPNSLSEREHDRLEVALRVAGTDAQSETSVQVSESLVERARKVSTSSDSSLVEESTKAAGAEVGKQAWNAATGATATKLPAGLPLLPVPGSWYATANAWTVAVEGSYDRFAVRAYRVAPGTSSNGTVEYVREERTVTADVDGDGDSERLGTNRELSLDARTGVVIVVPPGGTGVGDVDGQRSEESPAW
ncbi:MAG: hypothetical protein U5K70_00315 [Halodesulfurarchaeum sp.]|nr:hypothetical protein [Halodesulfurarchaeum sp.]